MYVVGATTVYLWPVRHVARQSDLDPSSRSHTLTGGRTRRLLLLLHTVALYLMQYLEPLLKDYHKIKKMGKDGGWLGALVCPLPCIVCIARTSIALNAPLLCPLMIRYASAELSLFAVLLPRTCGCPTFFVLVL